MYNNCFVLHLTDSVADTLDGGKPFAEAVQTRVCPSWSGFGDVMNRLSFIRLRYDDNSFTILNIQPKYQKNLVKNIDYNERFYFRSLKQER